MKTQFTKAGLLHGLACLSTRMAILGAMAFTPIVSMAQGESNQYDESGNQATLYVAPSGSDTNDGSFEAPFKTISRAQKEVRKLNETMTGDIVVCLRGGTYQLASTLTLNNLDGGKQGHYVRPDCSVLACWLTDRCRHAGRRRCHPSWFRSVSAPPFAP